MVSLGPCLVETKTGVHLTEDYGQGLGTNSEGCNLCRFLPNFAHLGSWNVAMFVTVEQVRTPALPIAQTMRFWNRYSLLSQISGGCQSIGDFLAMSWRGCRSCYSAVADQSQGFRLSRNQIPECK